MIIFRGDTDKLELMTAARRFTPELIGKEHAIPLKSALENKYKVTTDWEGKLYIGIELKGTIKKARSRYP